ncbi:NAD(P)-dependent oxidoreductase [Nocardia mangyaensis]|uniref:NAD(P)-dependent oxidoreductase n=1 Tax=Nocardia mangyaensis TaxID=2213200 RepID=UPI002675CE3D|nr:NAD(P)-binding domain-containing protein [Nocardia mangyaensis]MDO3650445.1 NAD(P)-binding domain-containing protein [Nocardia mangyaensis]
MTKRPTPTSVTVLGRGVRAAALTGVLAADNVVTVWGDESAVVETHSVRRAESMETAVERAALVVVCVDDYAAATRVLHRAEQYLRSRDVVNLTSGTSAQAKQLAGWVGERGARYLDGALMAHPEHVGKPETVLVYSGSADAFADHRPVLEQLGSTTYLGTDPGTAALYDVAMLSFAWATLLGYLHTAALLRSAEVRAVAVAPLLNHWLSTTVTSVITDYAHQIDEGKYPGDEEWLELDAPLMDHLVEAAEDRGISTELPRLIRSITRRGIEDGRGADSFASLIESIVSSRPAAS